MTHRELLSAIDDVYYSTASNQYRDFLQLTLNSIVDRKGDVTRVIGILENYGIFDSKTNVFLFDEAKKDLTDKIRKYKITERNKNMKRKHKKQKTLL